MREPARLALQRRLLDAQRVERLRAEVQLAAAQGEEARLAREMNDAEERLRSAEEAWLAYVREPGFMPQLSRALSTRLLARENELKACALQVKLASDRRHEREREWHRAGAQLRAGTAAARRLEKRIAGKREDSRLAAAVDAMLHRRTRP